MTRNASYGVIGLGVLLVVAITATIGWRPFIGPRARPLTDRKFAATPARLERGKYLATGAVPCVLCHSEMKVGQGLAVADGMAFSGRNFTPDGIPFATASNLTPDPETGIGTWSDDMLARAIREGISHDGRTLFPLMPYPQFRHMTDEDLASVIVYLRSLPPLKHELPKTELPFPMRRLINSVPEPIEQAVTADLSTPEKRGEYLVTIAACAECHTPLDDHGGKIPGLDFAGGLKLEFTGNKTVYSANITPGVNGIPYYTEELFLEATHTGRVRERKLSEMMPTAHYRNMTDDDLKSIFAFLKTLKPVDHHVDNSLPPTKCPRCGLEHGGGERNAKN
jgi:hypothetical protein